MLPNPIPTPILEKRPPTADDVRAARTRAGHTQADAAAVVYMTDRAWRNWELGSRTMPLGLYELYVIKTAKRLKIPYHD